MARSLCTCGQQIRWKADEPESDEWLLIGRPDLPDDLGWSTLQDVSTPAAFCPACGRLWVDWGDGTGALAEYVPVDPSVRPVRRTA